jgi:hypothetical protein
VGEVERGEGRMTVLDIIDTILLVVAFAAVLCALVRDPDDNAPVSLERPSGSRAPAPYERARRKR